MPAGVARIFGTDGVRGRALEGWLAPDAVSIIGRAAGEVLSATLPTRGRRQAVLGHDGRRSGPVLEAALARGLAKSGFQVLSAGLITTPGLALIARRGSFQLAAMVSASHNPAEDNGIKLFAGSGEKLSDGAELAIERRLSNGLEPVRDGSPPALAPELEVDYLTCLVEEAGAGLELRGLCVAVDCANGGASRVAPRVLGRLGAQVNAVHADPDGDNINRGCGSTQPASLQAEVQRSGAWLGIALDGDGDRCILVDERGQVVHGDGILAVCARHAIRRGEWKDPRVVATVMSNKGLHRALREVGASVVTVDVGDKSVVEALRREKLRLGGEQSGHIVFGPDHFYIGDGIYTALRVLRILRETEQPLSELASCYQPFPQVLRNVPVGRKPHLSQIPRVAEAVRQIEAELGDDGRVLLRYSGTEPLARVMIEGPDGDLIRQRAQALVDLIAQEIGA